MWIFGVEPLQHPKKLGIHQLLLIISFLLTKKIKIFSQFLTIGDEIFEFENNY